MTWPKATLVLLAPALAWTLEASPQAGAGAPRRPAPRDEAFKMVDAYVVSNLQESLGLTDEQFVKLLPLVKRFHSDRRDYAQRRRRALQELRRLLASGSATEAGVAQSLRELKGLEAEQPTALRKDTDAIDGVLNPLQQAKYRVLEAEVDRKIRELMNQIRMQRAGPRGRRPAPPEGDPPPAP